MTKSSTFALPLVLGVLTGLLTAAGAKAETAATDKLNALFGDEIIVRADGFTISQSALDESMVTIRSSAAGRQQGNLSKLATERLEREVTRRLINIQLLKQLATDEDREAALVKADGQIDALIERAGTEAALDRQLKSVALTRDRLRQKLIEEATAEVVLERELQIEVSDEEIEKYYKENPDRFLQPERVRVAHILFRTADPRTRLQLSEEQKQKKYKEMERLLERARNGEDFSRLVEEYTEDARSRSEGGEYVFARGQMFPAFEAASFTVPEGQISDVITTPEGYHIIKVYEKLPSKPVELDDEVKEEVRNFLKGQELTERMQPFIETLMEKANVEILVERLKPQEGDNLLQGVTPPASERPATEE